MLLTLGFPKPPVNITPTEVWAKVEVRLKELLAKVPKEYLGQPLLKAHLTDDQWHKLMEINRVISDDFQMRRDLLLTRLDVTIQSFKWADRLKSSSGEISNLYNQKRKELSSKQSVKMYEIIAARDGMFILILLKLL
jgi:protein FAM98B